MTGRSIAPPAPPLTDGAIAVRRRELDDIDAIRAASRDPETIRWLDDDPAEEGADEAARAAAVRRADDAMAAGTAAPLTIADPVTGVAKGLINLQLRSNGLATMAYAVFPDARGRGIATRAVRLVAAWAFGDLAVTELRLEIDPLNIASTRVAADSGFRRCTPVPPGTPDGEDVWKLLA